MRTRFLARFRSLDGLVIACLVEPDSAHVLDTVVLDPDSEAAGPIVAAGASDVVQVLALLSAGLGEPDELEDVVITFGRRHYLITPIPGAGVDGLIVVIALDRTRTNLALARLQLRALGDVS